MTALPRVAMLANRTSRIAALLILIAASALIASDGPTRGFEPYVAAAPPQGVLGDFDGDGRLDVARIQNLDGPPHVSVRLSGSIADVRLDAAIAVLIDNDIDDDGDLDLVAATASGDIVIWLNDGHGRFTRQTPARAPTVGGESASFDSGSSLPTAIGVAAPVVSLQQRSQPLALVACAGPPTAPLDFDRDRLLPPGLRAPPARPV
ncbi:MAG TPA: FG-GAP-like repeat-containing protein [Vicinamibacterales bacterium]|nr:FG-GAP-like repeat-containing protein [Vicinamibacterales bacterium]